MTELSFLIELLLNHKLSAATKKAVAERIKEVERGVPVRAPAVVPQIGGAQQAASTLAAMARHEGLVVAPPPTMPPIEQPVVIAQTPAAAAAMNSRNEAIAQSLAGKVDKTTGRPRKF